VIIYDTHDATPISNALWPFSAALVIWPFEVASTVGFMAAPQASRLVYASSMGTLSSDSFLFFRTVWRSGTTILSRSGATPKWLWTCGTGEQCHQYLVRLFWFWGCNPCSVIYIVTERSSPSSKSGISSWALGEACSCIVPGISRLSGRKNTFGCVEDTRNSRDMRFVVQSSRYLNDRSDLINPLSQYLDRYHQKN
jgi:hypothetical protein